MIRNTLFFLFFAAVSIVAISCEDSAVAQGGPATANMMNYWNASSVGNRIMTGAIFEHDDHDKVNCGTCHTNGDKSPVTLPAGSTIYGVSLANNAAHNFCISCHTSRNDGPTLSFVTCAKCHKGSTSPFSGGVIDLNKNWVKFFPTGTSFTQNKVLLSHYSHRANACSACHTGNPSNLDGTWPIVPAGMLVPEASADAAKTKLHAYCDNCHADSATAPKTTGNCSACHK